MFGRSWAEYVSFHRVFLALILAVGLARLGLSLAGLPDSSARWVSMNVPLWAGTLACGVAVHRTGFGGYRQLLPLVFLQLLPLHAVALLGIGLAAAGHPNILAAPEYGGQFGHTLHAAAHLTLGLVIPSLLLWGVAALTLRITRSLAERPTPS